MRKMLNWRAFVPTMTNFQGAEPDLNGWKNIAAHLGVSVREAQSREKDAGMPVRRMPGRKSRVWADREELDNWKQRVSAAKSSGAAVSLLADGSTSEAVPAAAEGTIRRLLGRRRFLGGLAASTVAASGGAWLLVLPHSAIPARAGQIGKALCVWDDAGRIVWKHSFPENLVDPAVRGTHTYPPRNIQLAHLAGSSEKQVLFGATFAESEDPYSPTRDELYCFAADGKLRWTYTPNVSVTFGDREFHGPWEISDVLVDRGPRPTRVWVTLAHREWRPGVLLAIDPDGKAVLQFVNAGHLYRIGFTPDGDILVGGINNEYSCGALAVLRRGAAPSRSPQTAGSRYECVAGFRDGPKTYFLFPPTELNAAADKPYNRVLAAGAVDGRVKVTTEEVGEINQEPLASAIYGFSPDMQPQDVAFDDNFAVQHHRFEAAGRLDHPLGKCPMLNAPRHIRRWAARTGWATIDVPLKKGVGPDSYQR